DTRLEQLGGDLLAQGVLGGAPPGYLGHDREGRLSGPLRDQPHSVVLFDEVEKAHPEILDLLLQICDEGQLTDAWGRRVPFGESVVIMTSNLGAARAPAAPPRGPFGFGGAGLPSHADEDTGRERIMAALRAELRPELLGRIGDIVVFSPLTPAALEQVFDKLLAQVRERLRDRSVELTLTDAARRLLLRHGTDARTGARALEHAVDRLLVQPLGRALLAGTVADGAAVVADADADADGDALALSPGGARRPDESPDAPESAEGDR
ncbi:AAA family ATPase, partial [Kitasatospora sp. NPDC093558]|uniref:AAA family ATPase n=1 Tax=Kitasatospora sp. NPDC093558 TaxID=3155201 RepID=UPI003435213E